MNNVQVTELIAQLVVVQLDSMMIKFLQTVHNVLKDVIHVLLVMFVLLVQKTEVESHLVHVMQVTLNNVELSEMNVTQLAHNHFVQPVTSNVKHVPEQPVLVNFVLETE